VLLGETVVTCLAGLLPRPGYDWYIPGSLLNIFGRGGVPIRAVGRPAVSGVGVSVSPVGGNICAVGVSWFDVIVVVVGALVALLLTGPVEATAIGVNG
jgi:hypothetical protein